MEFHENFDASLETETLNDYETERNKPMPSKNHARLQARLSFLFMLYFEKRFSVFSELSLELSSGKANPDLAIYELDTANWMDDEIKVTKPPLTAIEILSPKQGIQDVTDKIFEKYFAAGVKSAWLIVPTFQTIYLLTPDRKVSIFTTGKLTDPAIGVELEMAEIFV